MAETYLTDEPVPTGPLLFLRSIRKVLGRAPLWLLTWAMLVLLALPIGAIWYAGFSSTVADRYHPDRVPAEVAGPGAEAEAPFLWDDIVFSLTASFRNDHEQKLADLNRTAEVLGAVLALVAILVGVFVAGGWLQVILERTHGRSVQRFFLGGARYFWRFLRVFVLMVALWAAWGWLVYEDVWNRYVLGAMQGVPEKDWKELETLGSELTVRMLGWLQDGTHALGFLLILAWGTFTRTRLALLDGHSALKGGLLTFFQMLGHPIKTLRPLVLLFLTELLVVTVICGLFTRWLEDGLQARPSLGLVAAMLLVGLFALMWRAILRGARYHAAVKVSQEIVRRPPKQPDPWKAIGGPGGPQYPVEGDEEAYVAL